MDWANAWTRALPYGEFLARHGEPRHLERWQRIYDQVALTPDQRALVVSFTRQMHLLCVAGAWCGDCVLQGPILERIGEANPAVAVRFIDRDAHPDVQDAVVLNQGRRVPVVVFLSEDFEECGRSGDRTLSTYRRMARDRLGPSCPTGIVPPDDTYVAAVTQDWMEEVERIQLMLRLSPRLRQKHGD
jgi:thiol-disulfide isomerase/thioredoxin